LLSTVNSSYLRMVFDPANFVQCGGYLFSEAYPLRREYIEYIHIKDAFLADGKVIVAGAGDGEV
jgi:sugar phosphate isomerase/epimerase